MTPGSPSDPEREILREQEIARLFARASELDAVRGAGTEIAQLRATAAEAGISASAFDAALAEMRDKGTPPERVAHAAPPRSRRRRWGAMVAISVAVSIVFGTRMLVPSRAPAAAEPMVEQAILLNCLAPGDAAELVRPLLRDQTSTVVHSVNAPRVLTVRTSPEQMERVQELLQERDRPESAACAVRQTTP